MDGGRPRNAWASSGEHASFQVTPGALWVAFKKRHALDQSLGNLEDVGGSPVPLKVFHNSFVSTPIIEGETLPS